MDKFVNSHWLEMAEPGHTFSQPGFRDLVSNQETRLNEAASCQGLLGTCPLWQNTG